MLKPCVSEKKNKLRSRYINTLHDKIPHFLKLFLNTKKPKKLEKEKQLKLFIRKSSKKSLSIKCHSFIKMLL